MVISVAEKPVAPARARTPDTSVQQPSYWYSVTGSCGKGVTTGGSTAVPYRERRFGPPQMTSGSPGHGIAQSVEKVGKEPCARVSPQVLGEVSISILFVFLFFFFLGWAEG
jgi:hypothetical protein